MVDREAPGDREQVPIASNENGALLRGQSDEVVVVRIRRADRRWTRSVTRESRRSRQPGDQLLGVIGSDKASNLRVSQRAPEFLEERRRDNQFELSSGPRAYKLGRAA